MRGRWLGTLALVACTQACASGIGPTPVDTSEHAVLPEPVELELRYGENVPVPGTDLQVAFDSVLSDSRCPVDVTCIWQGNAVVRLRLVFGEDDPLEILLNTGVEPTSQGIGGYQVGVLDLSPLPHGREPIPLGTYQVKVRVESI